MMEQAIKMVDDGMIEAEENFLIDCQFLVQDLINSSGLTRTQLAKRAGISKARLSQILSAEANPSVKTFARLYYALGATVSPKVNLKDVGRTKSVSRADSWNVVIEKTAFSPNTAKAVDWVGASNDNCTVIESNFQTFALKAA